MRKETIERFVDRAADACRTVGAPSLTLMLQARDTDPLAFDSVLRVGDANPFGDDGEALTLTREVNALLRDRSAAHQAAERAVHMADLNRRPDFVNAYLHVRADGEAKLHVHCGTGLTTRILREVIAEAPGEMKVA